MPGDKSNPLQQLLAAGDKAQTILPIDTATITGMPSWGSQVILDSCCDALPAQRMGRHAAERCSSCSRRHTTINTPGLIPTATVPFPAAPHGLMFPAAALAAGLVASTGPPAGGCSPGRHEASCHGSCWRQQPMPWLQRAAHTWHIGIWPTASAEDL